jgi:hypothetical protein
MPISVMKRIGAIAMTIAKDSASYPLHGGSVEAAHVSNANGASKSSAAVTAATMTASAATCL